MVKKKKTTDERIDVLAGSIEHLAQSVKRGFDDTATKGDLERMATRQQLQLVVDNQDLMRADIHDIKLTLGPLVRHVVGMEDDVSQLKKRMDRVERKVGLAR